MGTGKLKGSRFKCFSFKRSGTGMQDYVMEPHALPVKKIPTPRECTLTPLAQKNDSIVTQAATEEVKEMETQKPSRDVYDPFVSFRSSSKRTTSTSQSPRPKETRLTKLDDTAPPTRNTGVAEANYMMGYGLPVLGVDDAAVPSSFKGSISRSLKASSKMPSIQEGYTPGTVLRPTIATSNPPGSRRKSSVEAGTICLAGGSPSTTSAGWHDPNLRFISALVPLLGGFEIQSCQLTCKNWYRLVKQTIDLKCQEIVNKFKVAYDKSLKFDSWSVIYLPIYTAKSGLRIDLLIRAKILNSCGMYKNSFGYTYSYIADNEYGLFGVETPRKQTPPLYINKFVFECLKRHCIRTITFTRDFSFCHGDELNVAAETTCQVCEGDLIEFPVILTNAMGHVDAPTVRFMPMQRNPLELDVGSKIDQMHREWFTIEPNSKYLDKLFPENIGSFRMIEQDAMLPQLEHRYTQVAGIDVITSRSLYVAKQVGPVAQVSSIIGHTLEVIDRNAQVLCMLQRAGIQHDRTCKVQVRVGDKVHLYFTR